MPGSWEDEAATFVSPAVGSFFRQELCCNSVSGDRSRSENRVVDESRGGFVNKGEKQ